MANGLFDPSVLFEALKNAGMLPQWSNKRPYGGQEGMYYTAQDRMVAPSPDNPYDKNSMAHEMTHAVQNNLLLSSANTIAERIRTGAKVSEQELRFLDASKKIFNKHFGTVGQFDRGLSKQNEAIDKRMMDSLYFKGNKPREFDDYRTARNERQAWGVGNMASPLPDATAFESRPAPPHFDASMATELSLLLEMYTRLPDEVKEQSKASRQQRVEAERKNNQDSSSKNYQFEQLMTDPFKNKQGKAPNGR